MLEFAARAGLEQALHLPGPQLEMGCWYRAMDVCLLTSLSEGMPNIATEAQYCGVPIVLSDVGGSAESIEPGETGWLVSPHDAVEAYLRHLELLYRDAVPARAAAEKARAFVQREYSMERMMDEVLAAYDWDRDGGSRL